MFNAIGWAIVRSSRVPYTDLAARLGGRSPSDSVDAVDELVEKADDLLFLRLKRFLSEKETPDLDWHFRAQLNHLAGVLHFSSSCNHRSDEPTAIEVFRWLATHAPGSYGLVYIHDDNDTLRRGDYANVHRVWRLLGGSVEELQDPFLSPIVPGIDPFDWA